jgi:Spy/CpxP family protein refolding chaperone
MLKLLTLLAGILLFAGLATAESEHGKGDKQFGPGKMNPEKFLKEEIGLSDDQQKKLEAIRLENARQMEECRHQIETEKLAVQELAVKGTLTKAKLKESLKKIEDARGKMHAARFQGAQNALDIFTDDQIKKIADKHMLNMLIEGRDGREGHDGPDGRGMGNMGKGCPMMEKGGK